jgi:hypothetical protein
MPWKFALFLAFAVVAIFPDVIFGAKTFYFSDFSGYGYPAAHFYRESVLTGQIPLWNPLSNCGLPFLAQWNTQVLYPLSLFYVYFPLSWALGVFCVFHLWLAGVGMYILALHLTKNRVAASYAGLVFSFNGLVQESILLPTNVATLAWMPWVVLCSKMAFEQGGHYIALASIVCALQVFSGTPEVVIFTWITVGALWLSNLCTRDCPRRTMFLRCCLVFTLTLALSAGQLFPFIDLLAHSQLSVNYCSNVNSMPVAGIVNYVLPLFHCYRSSVVDYIFLDGQRFFSSYYLGVTSIILVVIAAFRARSRDAYILLLITIFSIVLAMGNNSIAYRALRHFVPLLGFMRYPVKFVILSVFTIPLLSAYGLTWLTGCAAKDSNNVNRVFCSAIISVVIFATAMIWMIWEFPHPMDDTTMAVWNSGVRVIFMIAICWALFIILYISNRENRHLAIACFLFLVLLDLATHIPNLAPTTSRGVYDSDLVQKRFSWVRSLRFGKARALVIRSQQAVSGMDLQSVADRRYSLSLNLNLLDNVPKADGFFPLYLRNMVDINTALNWKDIESRPISQFLGIKYIGSLDAGSWVVRDTAMPMLTSGQQPIFLNESNALQYVTGDDFRPDQFVCLPLAAEHIITASNCSEARIISSTCRPQRISIDVESASPTMLVIAQAYYHQWHAYVSGRRVPLWQANYAFQALELPRGRHDVQIVYEDSAFALGKAISIFSWLTCVFVLLHHFFAAGPFIAFRPCNCIGWSVASLSPRCLRGSRREVFGLRRRIPSAVP